jgi:hypothetical protein
MSQQPGNEQEFISVLISKCCRAFIAYQHGGICSKCKNKCVQIKNEVTIGTTLNPLVTTDQPIFDISKIAKRFSTDPTFQICSKKCVKCKSYCRYFRGSSGEFCFVCSNGACREVYLS